MLVDQKPPKHTNRLIRETSPYLLQHAHNPVDWYPWGEEALARAKNENRPILLSIGYSSCHWCHVMEKESFEDEEIAKVMNTHFVCIKVDREERPDLDEIYMAATTTMNNGQGGWPMTLVLTPDQRPFFAGTYFPPTDQYGRPGFANLLTQIVDAWKSNQSQLIHEAKQLTDFLSQKNTQSSDLPIGKEEIAKAVSFWKQAFDPVNGGFGKAPKFPPTGALAALLRNYHHTKEDAVLHIITTTLDHMASGGIYDHIGGGFARYAVDDSWLVPHFEKMLYDNALIADVYLEAFQLTKRELYREKAIGIFEYVLREMTSEEGGFYSSQDADSEHEEGKFYIWSVEEIQKALPENDARLFCAYYDITSEGNWEGKNIPHVPRSLEEVAKEFKLTEKKLNESLERSRETLFNLRNQRIKPAIDDKCLTSWNALMISALAGGYRVLNDARYLEAAQKAADFILKKLRDEKGHLLRTYRKGKAHLNGYLEDYAFFASALIDLYEAGGNVKNLFEAETLVEILLDQFWDPKSRTFFNTASDHEELFLRYREGTDSALPSPNAGAAHALAKLSYYFNKPDYREWATQAIIGYGKEIYQYPFLFAKSLCVLDLILSGPVEITLVGSPAHETYKEIEREINSHFIPNHLFSYWDNQKNPSAPLPLLSTKHPVADKPVLYICRNFQCLEPLSNPSAIQLALEDLDKDKAAVSTGLLAVHTAGKATSEGTAAFAKRGPEQGYRLLGSTGLTVSKIGFGCYRVDDAAPVYRQSIEKAIESGCNVIDTSTNYTDGHSEHCIGSLLQELFSTGKLRREEIVVVSKIGYVQGRNLHLAKEMEATSSSFSEMVKHSPECWHCIHPDFLKDQIKRSLDRLQLKTIDVLLLHNPEYFFTQATRIVGSDIEKQRTEFYNRLKEAFKACEELAKAGLINYYGVSSNTVAHPSSDPESTSFIRILKAAIEAGGKNHRFKVLQFPLNLIESAPALSKPEGGETILELASKENIGVLVNRPLNAIVEGNIVRLANFRVQKEGIDFPKAIQEIAYLENEWRENLAKFMPKQEGGTPPEKFFQLSIQLRSINGKIDSYCFWEQIEQQQIFPQLSELFQGLDNYFSRTEHFDDWMPWKQRYIQALEQIFSDLERQGAIASEKVSSKIAKAIDSHLPKEYQGKSLSSKALWTVSSTPGVSCVLNGMRNPGYVQDSMEIMSWPALDNTAAIYRELVQHPLTR